MTVREWWGRFKIFLWYLATEPWRQFVDSWRYAKKLWAVLTRTMTWAYVTAVIAIVAYFLGRRVLAGLALLYVLILVLIWEWQDGRFMARYRQQTALRIKKALSQTEAHRNQPYRPDRRPPHGPT